MAEYANIPAQFADDIAHGRSPKIYVDGPQTWEFTHIDGFVRGLVAAAEHELDEVYNLRTGESYDFNTVVGLLNEELGTSVKPVYTENPMHCDRVGRRCRSGKG